MAMFYPGFQKVNEFVEEAMKAYFPEDATKEALHLALAKYVGDFILAHPTYFTAVTAARE